MARAEPQGERPAVTGEAGVGERSGVVEPGRLARLGRLLPVRVAMRFGADSAGTWAAAVALNMLLSLFPIVLSLLFAVSLVLRDAGTRDEVLAQVARTLPGGAGGETYHELAATVDAVRQGTGILGVLGLAGLLWGGSGLFGAIETAFGAVYRFRPRDLVPGKLMAFGLIVAYALLSVVGVGASAALAVITPVTEQLGVPDVMTGAVRYVVGVLVGTAVGVVLFGLIFRVVPRGHRPWSTVLPGALLAGVGFEVLTLIFPLYIRLAGGGNRYGQIFGILLVLVSYFSLLAQLLMLGACLNAVLDDDRRARLEVTSTATPARARPGATPAEAAGTGTATTSVSRLGRS